MTAGTGRAARARTDEEWRLRDERDLLRRSLDDAALEHLAGDLTDEDYELLRTRDVRRLAEVDAVLDGHGSEMRSQEVARGPRPGARSLWRPRWRPRWRRRWWFAALGAVSVVAATVLLVLDLTSPRLPGEYATGSISLNAAQEIERQLGQAQALAADGKDTEAMGLYGEVLAEDPRQPVALSEWGWLDWREASAAKEATVAAEGASALEEAVRIDRRLFAAQYYLGVVLYDEGAAVKAVAHFESFLGDNPTAKWLRDAASEIRAAYRAAHEPVPSGLPAASAAKGA